MQPIPLIHRSVLLPAIEILDNLGAPTDSLLRRNRLPPNGYDSPTGFLPVLPSWAFIEDSARTQGLWDFGFRTAESATLARASRWGPRVAAAPTLSTAIHVMSACIGADLPNVRIGLQKRDDAFWFWRDHRPDRRRLRGYWVGEQYILGLMVEIVRRAAGDNWFPSQIEVQAHAQDWEGRRPTIAGDAHIEFGAPKTAVALPLGSLGARMTKPEAPPLNTLDLPRRRELPACDLQGSLLQVLRSLVCEGRLSISLGAELLETSELDLRRYLRSKGTSWTELVDLARLEASIELILESSKSLFEIADFLGYSEYAQFEVAFRRWTGVSPREYREDLAYKQRTELQ